MRRILWTAGLSAALGFSACAEAPTADPMDLGYDGKTGLAVTIAPLDLASITDACYSFEITNQNGDRVVARGSQVDAQQPGQGSGVAGQSGDGGPELTGDALAAPLSNPLCADQFGNGEGAISYVAPCDASDGNQNHTIRLWVNSVCAGGSGFVAPGCTPLAGFVNPCGSGGCEVQATCTENADTPVSFNFTVMASAQQGFFDIAVNFDNVFCSAKMDDCYDEGDGTTVADDGIFLLHNASGTRVRTAVLAVACSGGTADDVTTVLQHSQIGLTCGNPIGGHSFNLAGRPEGNFTVNNGTNDLRAAVYFGTESLSGVNKVYTNVALAIDDAGPCDIFWRVIPSDGGIEAPAAGEYTSLGAIEFGGLIARPNECDMNPLNENPAGAQGVRTVYHNSENGGITNITNGIVSRYTQDQTEGTIQAD